jgi:hypothetical protein
MVERKKSLVAASGRDMLKHNLRATGLLSTASTR